MLPIALLFLALSITAFAAPAHAREHNEVLAHGRVNLTGLEQALAHVDNPTALEHLQQNLDRYTAILEQNKYENATVTVVDNETIEVRATREYHLAFLNFKGTDVFTLQNGELTKVHVSMARRIFREPLDLRDGRAE